MYGVRFVDIQRNVEMGGKDYIVSAFRSALAVELRRHQWSL